MRRVLAGMAVVTLGLLGAQALTLRANERPTPKGPNEDGTKPALVKIAGEGMMGSHAFQFLTELSDDVGSRVTGSPAERKAEEWGVAKMKAIGLENVPVIHANDSKIPLGGRVDRHEHIGKGKIGAEAFARILRHPRFGAAGPEGLTGRAFIAETPIDDPGDDRRNVAALWELAGLKEQAPEADKGFSMLTAALQKKIAIHQKSEKKRKAAAKPPRRAETKARKKAGAKKSSAKRKRG